MLIKLLLVMMLAFAMPVMSMEKPTNEGYQLELIELQLVPMLPDVNNVAPVTIQRSYNVSGDAESILVHTKELSNYSPVQPYLVAIGVGSGDAHIEVGWQNS